jgi:hypothetical protein
LKRESPEGGYWVSGVGRAYAQGKTIGEEEKGTNNEEEGNIFDGV